MTPESVDAGQQDRVPESAAAELPLDDVEAAKRVARVLHQTWCPLGTCDYGEGDYRVAYASVRFVREARNV